MVGDIYIYIYNHPIGNIYHKQCTSTLQWMVFKPRLLNGTLSHPFGTPSRVQVGEYTTTLSVWHMVILDKNPESSKSQGCSGCHPFFTPQKGLVPTWDTLVGCFYMVILRETPEALSFAVTSNVTLSGFNFGLLSRQVGIFTETAWWRC